MTTTEQIKAAAKAAKKAGVDAAMSLAEDIATGRLDPAALDAAAVAEARALFGRVEGPDDPLWELHVDIARQVLAVGGGLPADELAEWLAVTRAAEGAAPEPEAAEDDWTAEACDEVLAWPPPFDAGGELPPGESIVNDTDVPIEVQGPPAPV
ncbi:hypothetical protein A5784_14030 [Mycobacterium sp. 852013-50091_SCH5140682]|uniref:hypothetical protein n=1 Tax=Mycobacterium sp. 852013-50091_SCH5140682 TaxID=1834109 RepID=UPI0007E93CA3|nr:hypothetical protein [Mycobacterium sp. 852013-50091_SCH5140682]OBC03353.1 hypothetical protein A5784_14030 [Mycobacterium sp. 852013-50091_SCH5140682]